MRNIRERLVTVYSKNDDTNNYNTQGLGSLPDWLSATVNAKLNGGEFFTGSYDSKGVNADKLQVDNILNLFIDENRPRQRMRIYKAKRDIITNTIEVEAEPIFSDIRRHVAKKFAIDNTTANNAFSQVATQVTPKLPTKYRFVSTVDTIASIQIEDFNMLEFFGGKEGSILDRFKGEFRRDNNTLYHEKRLGREHKVKLVYTKNLTGLNLEVDGSTIVVGIYPYISSGSEDEAEIQLPEKVIFTEYAETYPNGIVQFVDFKEKATDVATLRTQAEQWLKTNVEATKPKISGTVEMIPLKHQKGYEKFVTMNTVELGDGVDVYHPELEDTISARVVEYDYNVLNDSYEKLVVGNIKANFLENMDNSVSDLINNAIDQLTKDGQISDLINDVVDHQTDLITGNSGGHVLLDPKEQPSRILIMDTADKDTARNVLQINQKGIGFSQTGINGQYTTAWTLDGGFNASFITAGEIVGITIKGSTLISQGADFTAEIKNGEIAWKRNSDGKVYFKQKAVNFYSSGKPISNIRFQLLDNAQGFSVAQGGSDNPPYKMSFTEGIFDTHNKSSFTLVAGTRNDDTSSPENYAGVTGFYSTGVDITHRYSGKVTIASVRSTGFSVAGGTKNASVSTETYGQRLLNAYETPENYFADYGEAYVGEKRTLQVPIDPIYAETVTLGLYHVFLTPNKLCQFAVTETTPNYFTIETDTPNVTFSWNIVAHRKGFECQRLEVDKHDYKIEQYDQTEFN